MKRHLYATLGSLVIIGLVIGCAEDPTASLRGDLARVTINRFYDEMAVGTTAPFQASSYDSQGNVLPSLPEFTVADPSVLSVTVDSFQTNDPLPRTFVTARAVGFGTTFLIATADGVADTALVVTFPVFVDLVGAGATLGSGGTVQLTPEFLDLAGNLYTPAGNAADTLVWSSSSASTASVDQTGLVTGAAPGTVTITAALRNGTAGQWTLDVVPGTFAGTVAPTSGSSFDLITVTRDAAGPEFDADSKAFIDGVQMYVDSFTADQLTFVIPPTGNTGAVTLLFTDMGPNQISQETAFTVNSLTTVDPYEPNDGPLTGITLTDGNYYFTLDGTDVDDFFTVTNATGADATVTVTLGWGDTGADIDILWTDAGFTTFVGNFDGASTANPEASTVTLPAGTTWNLWINMYDTHGSALDFLQMTVTGLP